MIRLSGRIDTTNAEAVEKEILSQVHASGDTAFTLDFDEVEYISSAGLRVLLKLKKQYPEFSLCNVSDEIYDIFDMTGFSQLLKIRRKLKTVSTQNLEVLGQGVTGTVYKIDEETILKAYNPHISMELVEKEREASRLSFMSGVPTMIAFDIVQTENGLGARYELMRGKTLAKAFVSEPENFTALVRKYVDLVKKVGNIQMPSGSFKDVKDILLNALANMKPYMIPEDYTLMQEVINSLPKADGFIHGDLHTGNIMMQGDELLMIDMADVAVGWKLYDFIVVYGDLYYAMQNPDVVKIAEATFGMSKELTDKVWNAFLAEYCETDDPETIAKMQKVLALMAFPISFTRVGNLPPENIKVMVPGLKMGILDSVIIPHKDLIKKNYSEVYTREDLLRWIQENDLD